MPRTSIVAGTALAVVSSVLVVASANATAGDLVRVCHWNDGAAAPLVIEVAEAAVAAHVGQHEGDGVVGVDVDESCQPLQDVPPGGGEVLARATSTAADGTEVLVGQLEDTDGDGTVSTGDTVVTGSYPLDMAGAAHGHFTVTNHAVDRVERASATEVRVSAGSAFFEWDTDDDGVGTELWVEEQAAVRTLLADGRSTDRPFDVLFVSPGSPSVPTHSLVIGLESAADDGFLQVEVAAP